jgi:hypothetical protein
MSMIESLRAATGLLADADVPAWDEAAVPLDERGISRTWLTRFVDDVQSYVNREVRVPPQFFRSKRVSPDEEPPQAADESAYRFLTTHGLVSGVGKPLTRARRAPLLAYVPEQFRGRPDSFVSYTWNSLLRGPERQRIGTVDALDDADNETYVWIDFVCYNQHVDASVSNDMRDVIASIGSVSIAATPTPLFTRSWCLWELLSAHRAAAAIDLRVPSRGYRNDKILAVNSLYRSFRGIEHARSVSARDQAEIYAGLVEHFGGEGAANDGIQKLIEEKFADPWFELQPRDAGVRYSPLPWVWSKNRTDEPSSAPFFLPVLLTSGLLGSEMSVGEVFEGSGIAVVAPEALDQDIDSRQAVDEDATTRGVRISDEPLPDNTRAARVDAQIIRRAGPTEQSPLNSTSFRMNCPNCGKPVEYLTRPRYFYSEEPDSAWSDFLNGLPFNRCACGVGAGGQVSSFHADSWTAVTLEPPRNRGFPAEVFAQLVDEVLTGVQLRPPLLLFGSFGEIQRAAAGGAAAPFLLVPYVTLIYQDVAETGRDLRVLLATAIAARLYGDAYLFIKNAAAIHPDIFWAGFGAAQEIAHRVEAATGDSSLQGDLEETKRQLAGWRRVPSLDSERVYLCFEEQAASSGASVSQTLYALRGHFDSRQELRLLQGEESCSSLPPWLLLRPPLSPAHKVLLDVHIHSAGESLLRNVPEVPQAITELLGQARDRIANRYAELSQAQRKQAREFYSAVGGQDLLDVL